MLCVRQLNLRLGIALQPSTSGNMEIGGKISALHVRR